MLECQRKISGSISHHGVNCLLKRNVLSFSFECCFQFKKKIGGIVIKVRTNLFWSKREREERERRKREREKKKMFFWTKRLSRKKKKKKKANVVFHCDLGLFLSFWYQLLQCKTHFKLKRWTKSLISIMKRKISIVKLYAT